MPFIAAGQSANANPGSQVASAGINKIRIKVRTSTCRNHQIPPKISRSEKDGTTLFSTGDHTVKLRSPSGRVTLVAGCIYEEGFEDGPDARARLTWPRGMTVDVDDNIMIVDSFNNAIRTVAKSGAIHTMAGNGEKGFVDGQGANARFSEPVDIVLAPNGDFLVSDWGNHAIRRVTPQGCVSTLAGCGRPGFGDGQGIFTKHVTTQGMYRKH